MVTSPQHPLTYGLPQPAGRLARPFPARTMPAASSQSRSGTKAVAVALTLGLIAPRYITLPLDSPLVTVMRGVLIILFFPALLGFLKAVGGRTQHLRASDVFMVLTCAWMLLAFTITEGVQVAAVSGNLYVLEVLGGYLAARAFFTTRADFETFISALGKVMIIVIAIALLDILTNRLLVADAVAQLVGKVPLAAQFREGRIRAQSTADHPIMYGTLCVFAAVLLYYGERTARRRVIYLALCMFGCVLATSSGPLMAAALALGVIAYDKVMRAFPWRWKLFWTAIAVPLVALFLLKNDPFATLIRNFTFDPQTGYFRLLIWQNAGADVLSSPWVGIGLADWRGVAIKGGSVDSVWLDVSLRFGIPASVLFGLVLLTAMRRSGPRVPERLIDPRLSDACRGLSLVLCLAMFVGITVHFWGVMWTLLGIMAGLRASLEEAREREVKQVRLARHQRARQQPQPVRPAQPIRTGPPRPSLA